MNIARMLQKTETIARELAELRAEIKAAEQAPEKKPDFMRIEDYATYRAVSIRTVYRWIKLGLPTAKRSGTRRVIVAEADKWDESEAIARNAEIAAVTGERR